MTEQITNTVMHPSVFEMLEQKLFSDQSVRDTLDDLEKMHENVMCNENTESDYERASFTMSFKIMHKTLTAIQKHIDPDDIFYLEINCNL